MKKKNTYDSVKAPKFLGMMRKRIGIAAIQTIIDLDFPGKGVRLFANKFEPEEEERLLVILALVLHVKNEDIFLTKKHDYSKAWVQQLVM